MKILDEIKEALMKGDANQVREQAAKAVAEGLDPVTIINDGFITAMSIIGTKFKNNEVYVPEVLVAARAMHAGMDAVKPFLAGDALQEKGTVLIGTVKGDLHDIGKNLVIIMLQGGGFKVVDLGIDVSAEKFVEAVKENKPDVVAISALLTSTIINMKGVIEGLADYRDQVKIIVGGAPVTQDFADKIGADAYAPDAASAVEKVRELVGAA
ncbi:corrinoid protein [Desulfitobacterium hafniense]|uniref:Methionine synthase n=5 Tax=root TaxID=1 RepID=Q24XE2_DESHY|nr:corrinoid protein [Desulfitobacterium hafniense]ACL20667.1 cobalamin B12-binding domain protein [Desulfitobacterium hafniense DCB-2]EHL07231.1 putative dimethylamine corrinoid protein [Desulfitobacterium hafniense DP7]KTE90957.1 methyltransferase [Desulfitobacterium hafniense]MEA5024796.1 corrinoid protein [Desulfitobacterium hafniense]CDX01571.1 O-demethylase corrinoid protein [Desulfitobacterium hafniense]